MCVYVWSVVVTSLAALLWACVSRVLKFYATHTEAFASLTFTPKRQILYTIAKLFEGAKKFDLFVVLLPA